LRQLEFASEGRCKTLTTSGYPCGQYLQQCLASGQPVPLSQDHCHWWFDPLNAERPISLQEQIVRELALPQHQENRSEDCSEADISGKEMPESVDEEVNGSICSMAYDTTHPAQAEPETEAPTRCMSRGGREKPGLVQRSMRSSGKSTS
jgi:hypothetical protein